MRSSTIELVDGLMLSLAAGSVVAGVLTLCGILIRFV